MAQTNTKKTSYLSVINMNYMEAIIENSSVKSVRKLQVMLSFQDKQRFLNLSNTSVRHYFYYRGRDYTVHVKQRKKTPNKLSMFFKRSFILFFAKTSKYKYRKHTWRVRSFAIMAISGHLSELNLNSYNAHPSCDPLKASSYILCDALSESSSVFQRCRQFEQSWAILLLP